MDDRLPRGARDPAATAGAPRQGDPPAEGRRPRVRAHGALTGRAADATRRRPRLRPGGALVVEKRKWDGTVASRTPARLLSGPGEPVMWHVGPGVVRERPRRGTREVTREHEVAVCGTAWIAVALGDVDLGVRGYHVDVALPAEGPAAGVLGFIDLDIDLVGGPGHLAVRDVEEFLGRRYPDRVRRQAWAGLEDAAQRFAEGRWPFGGWLDDRLRALRPEPGGVRA